MEVKGLGMFELGYRILDTAPFRGSTAFERLQEHTRQSPTPWTLHYLGGAVRSRTEIIGLENGFIVRGQATPNFTSVRTARDIAQSKVEFYSLVMRLSGSIAVRQGNHAETMRSGDIALLSGQKVSSFCPASSRTTRFFSLGISGPACRKLGDSALRSGPLVMPNTQGAGLLRQCMATLARDFRELSLAEASALHLACMHLLTAHFLSPETYPSKVAPTSAALIQFIDQHLADPELSVGRVAVALGLSNRRIHYLFAMSGTTFGKYVAERRVRYVAADLQSLDRAPIVDIAYRYGFSEMSTFRRAFRSVFGSTPSAFRKR